MSDALSSCRALAARARFGALATVARDPAGFPFATLVAVAFDGRGRPLMLLSRLAEHTKNLEACPRASLLVVPGLVPGSSDGVPAPSGDLLAAGRMTLVGPCALVPEGEAAQARADFLAAHAEAASYASLADFAPWRLEVEHVRWVGGFGRMSWVNGPEYLR
jgi:putative heme iron utilization protein